MVETQSAWLTLHGRASLSILKVSCDAQPLETDKTRLDVALDQRN